MTASAPDPTRLVARADELRLLIAARPVDVLARNTGAVFQPAEKGGGIFSLDFWQQNVRISFPELIASDAHSGQELSPFIQAQLIYHFHTADGAPLAGQYISFSELPNGRFYTQAFQGYTGVELGRAFQGRAEFERAAMRLGGSEQTPGSLSPGALAFRFQALPRLPVLVVYWEGDEDFPAVFQVLFDASASHYMPTDGCALLGSALTRKLISIK